MTENNRSLSDTLLSSIASARGFEYRREDDVLVLENDEFSTSDQNKIVKELLGQTATTKELASVDTILSYIKKLPNYEQLIAEAKDMLVAQGVDLPEPTVIETYQPNTIGWMRQLIDICK